MDYVQGGADGSVALLPGAWNPPTRAHEALARAALEWADRAVFVMPRRFPHKEFEDVSPEQRLRWLAAIADTEQRFSVAVSDGGLFIEMAREARAAGAARVFLVCGSDAAERIAGWDYGPGDSIESQLEEYELLVAARGAEYSPPAHLASRIHRLVLGPAWHDVSSSEVRRRIRASEPWMQLVPDGIAGSVECAYDMPRDA